MIISFVDIPLIMCFGGLSAVLYRRKLWHQNQSWYLFLTGSIIGIFWINVIAGNLLGTSYWKLGVPTTELTPVRGSLLALSYPLWFRSAGEFTFVLLGRHPDQGGLLWTFRLSDRTEPIMSTWESNDSIDDETTDQE